MTTEELVVLDQQAKEALNEIQRMSNMYETYVGRFKHCMRVPQFV